MYCGSIIFLPGCVKLSNSHYQLIAMKELRCPHCNSVFSVDDDMYESIAAQIRSIAFAEDVENRIREIRAQIDAEYKLVLAREEKESVERLNAQARELSERDKEIELLRQSLATASEKKELEMQMQIGERDKHIAALEEQLKMQAEAHKADVETQRLRAEQVHREEIARRDASIAQLQTAVAQNESNRQLALMEERRRSTELIHQKDTEIAGLRNTVESRQKENEAAIASLRVSYAQQLSDKDEQIRHLRDLKSRLSTKMLGETLEIHCHTVFMTAQSQGLFPFAVFDKDNDASRGSKGDFIFRDYIDGQEYISIMFEMKNEAEDTQVKHRNEDFLDKLNRDRNEKNCMYAVLVSTLERDSEFYNQGIVDMSHRYERMYVIRPQMFLAIISLLCNASKSNGKELARLRHDLVRARSQSVDVTNFEEKRDSILQDFVKYVEAHRDKHEQAIEGIDKVIESLERQIESLRKVKASFNMSMKKLLKASDTFENDFTVRKLTYKNPTMKAMFAEAERRRADGKSASDCDSADASDEDVHYLD